jgi:signal transduction histidine kinase
MFNIYNIPPLIAAFTNFFLFVFFLLRKKRFTVHLFFAFFCLALSVWNLGAFLSFMQMGNDWAIWAVKINSIGLVFIPATFLSFVFTFIKKKVKISFLVFLYSLSTLFLLSSLFSKLFFSEIVYRFWGYYPIGGPINHIFAAYLVICVIYGTFLLYWSLKKSRGQKRTQLTYVLTGFLLGFGGGFINLLPVSGMNIYPTGNVINIFYTLIIAYSIVKHRLMDIELIVKKSILYSLLIGAVGGTYVLITFLFGHVLQEFIGYGNTLAIIFTAFLIVLGYKPLEGLIEKMTDRIFFKGKYNYRRALKELSKEIASVIDLKQLLTLIVVGIAKIIKADKVSMLIREEPDNWYGLMGKYGNKTHQISSVSMKIDGIFTNYLTIHGELIITDEIINDDIKNALNKFETAICVPIIGKSGLIGIINIGDKLSEDAYTQEDLELFATIANQAAVALENAKLIKNEKDMLTKLEQSERLASLGRFAAGIVHEIKNPLVSIKTFLQVFGDQDEDQEDKQELAELATQEIVQIEGLLNNLLNFAKPSPPDFAFENIMKLLKETIQLIKPEFNLKKIKLQIINDTQSIPKVMIDKYQIKQVFINLIFNAMQAMPEGGSLVIRITHDRENNRLIIRFTDNGYGVSEKELNKLFDPFYTTKPGGTGMGLAVSYNIIKKHEGEIRVTSEPGKETTFKVILPISIHS